MPPDLVKHKHPPGPGGEVSYCQQCDPGPPYPPPRPFIRNYNDLADAIVSRIQLAVVQEVPAWLIDLLRDGHEEWVQLSYVTAASSDVRLHIVRRGDQLELSFNANGNSRVAVVRLGKAKA